MAKIMISALIPAQVLFANGWSMSVVGRPLECCDLVIGYTMSSRPSRIWIAQTRTTGEGAVKIYRHCVLFAGLSLAVSAAAAQAAKVNSVLDMPEFVHDWQISKQFTLEMANAMPADLYSFKPNPEEMTFGEQMIHI